MPRFSNVAFLFEILRNDAFAMTFCTSRRNPVSFETTLTPIRIPVLGERALPSGRRQFSQSSRYSLVWKVNALGRYCTSSLGMTPAEHSAGQDPAPAYQSEP